VGLTLDEVCVKLKENILANETATAKESQAMSTETEITSCEPGEEPEIFGPTWEEWITHRREAVSLSDEEIHAISYDGGPEGLEANVSAARHSADALSQIPAIFVAEELERFELPNEVRELPDLDIQVVGTFPNQFYRVWANGKRRDCRTPLELVMAIHQAPRKALANPKEKASLAWPAVVTTLLKKGRRIEVATRKAPPPKLKSAKTLEREAIVHEFMSKLKF